MFYTGRLISLIDTVWRAGREDLVFSTEMSLQKKKLDEEMTKDENVRGEECFISYPAAGEAPLYPMWDDWLSWVESLREVDGHTVDRGFCT